MDLKEYLKEIEKFVQENFDLSIDNMINELGLKRPIYKQTASFGHFGREEFPWEKIKATKWKPWTKFWL